jgi:hypothetical protein
MNSKVRKFTYLLTTVLILLIRGCKRSGWIPQTSGTTKNLLGARFTAAVNGIVVGVAGTILNTTDGGDTYTIQKSLVMTRFWDVSFTNTDTGTAVGGWCNFCYGLQYYSGYILHTTDGGDVKDPIHSSEYDDKCPFIEGNLMVLVSDRPGGYGGFDLYYSTYKDGEWTTPVNFSENINTEYDEYRPIVKTYKDEFTNDFMIFSSNRAGGKDGFDLYYVGISKMTE